MQSLRDWRRRLHAHRLLLLHDPPVPWLQPRQKA
jgi:hypothetical protein